MWGVVVLLVLAGGGVICGYLAAVRVVTLGREVTRLKRELRQFREQGAGESVPPPASPSLAPRTATGFERNRGEWSRDASRPLVANEAQPGGPAEGKAAAPDSQGNRSSGDTGQVSSEQDQTQQPSFIQVAFERLRNNWMIWLGGVCVSLAGIFLVRYSIDAGLLGPTARIGLGLVFGLLCVGRKSLKCRMLTARTR